MQALTVHVESDPFTRSNGWVSSSAGDQIDSAAFDVKKPFGTQIIDEFDDAVDRRSVDTGYAKILGANAKRQSLSRQPSEIFF